VVEIPGVDVQACAGTHVVSTSKLEAVKVLRTERIQDGVERIEFSAGPDAIKAAQKERALLEETAEELGVPVDQAPSAAQKFVKEWKELRTRVSSLEKELASFKSSDLEAENIGSIKFYSKDMGNADFAEVQKLVRELTSEEGSLAAMSCASGDKGTVVLAKSTSVNLDCGTILSEALSSVGGSGGGKDSYAQGACPKEKLNDALAKIRKLIT
jgi:alanyl-tRNA synthetase